jgi:3-deoxy-D-manno-octulosonic-acid transferase
MGSRRFLWIAASTHEGEDEIVLDVHKRLLQKYPDSLLILVPRHPHRFNAVYDLSTKDFVTARRTTMNSSLQQCQVYLADTVGEMLLLMGASDVCFMGGSMLGEKVGGHNYLEPAALKLPILSGPSYFNFQIIAEQLIEADALRICKDGDSIYSSLAHLAECEKARNEMGRCGAHIVERNRGALERTLHLLSIAPH